MFAGRCRPIDLLSVPPVSEGGGRLSGYRVPIWQMTPRSSEMNIIVE